METIWKYELETTDHQELELPLAAKVLTVQMQNGKPCLWALVDTEEQKAGQSICIFGTGHPVEFVGDYLGTYQLNDGALVFHVFKRLYCALRIKRMICNDERKLIQSVKDIKEAVFELTVLYECQVSGNDTGDVRALLEKAEKALNKIVI